MTKERRLIPEIEVIAPEQAIRSFDENGIPIIKMVATGATVVKVDGGIVSRTKRREMGVEPRGNKPTEPLEDIVGQERRGLDPYARAKRYPSFSYVNLLG